MGSVATSARSSRRRKPGETRQLLIDATMKVLSSGAEPTSVSITREAGLTQPAIYAHFKNVDECLLAAAHAAGARLQHLATERRDRLAQGGVHGLRQEMGRWLAVTAETGPIHDAFARFAADRGDLGAAVRGMYEHTRSQLAEELFSLASRAGVGMDHFPAFYLQAELIIAQVAAAGRVLHRGAVADAELVADTLTRNITSQVVQTIEACGGDPQRLVGPARPGASTR